MVPALVAPVLAFVVAGWRSSSPTGSSGGCGPGPSTRGFRSARSLSGGLLALAHGTNDAQKTMGVITLALVANGTLSAERLPTSPTGWSSPRRPRSRSAPTSGGWRIIKTMGSRIIKMDTAQGFAAQGAGAAVILASSHVGFPLSTTHTISGGVMGAGRREAAVGGALGRGRQHRRRLGPHAAGGRRDRRRSPTASRGSSAPAPLGPVVVSAVDPGRIARCCSRAASQQGPPSPAAEAGMTPAAPSRRLGTPARGGRGPRCVAGDRGDRRLTRFAILGATRGRRGPAPRRAARRRPCGLRRCVGAARAWRAVRGRGGVSASSSCTDEPGQRERDQALQLVLARPGAHRRAHEAAAGQVAHHHALARRSRSDVALRVGGSPRHQRRAPARRHLEAALGEPLAPAAPPARRRARAPRRCPAAVEHVERGERPGASVRRGKPDVEAPRVRRAASARARASASASDP